jgi:MprA protease rhombosortase-interaction domain-containing protein
MNRTALATGSALAACSLASVAAAQSALFSSLSDFSQAATAGAGTVVDSGTFGTPVDTLFSNASNGGTDSFVAFYSTGVHDTLYVEASRSSAFSGGTMSGSATINLLTAVSVFSLTPSTANSTFTWQLDSVTVNVGDVFTAGTYTLTWSGTQVGSTSLFAGQIYLAGPTAAVPLPSAVALAAAGLAGFGRRRRR